MRKDTKGIPRATFFETRQDMTSSRARKSASDLLTLVCLPLGGCSIDVGKHNPTQLKAITGGRSIALSEQTEFSYKHKRQDAEPAVIIEQARAPKMFARSIGARALRHCACVRRPTTSVSRVATRNHSSSTSPAPDVPTVISHPLAGVASQLDHVAPRFELDPSQIDILDSPTAFYETLKVYQLETGWKKSHAETLVGKDPRSKEAHLSFYTIHWQDGA